MVPESNMLERAVGVVARNSIDYVADCFRVLDDGKTVVPLSSCDDAYRIQLTRPSHIIEPEQKHGWFQPRLAATEVPENLAQISFTSGTEGSPKGVLLSRRALDDVTSRLQEVLCLTSDAREYIGVPVYHSFGYGRCRQLAQVGGSGFIPRHGFDPSELASLLREGRVNALSAVPSLLRIILKTPQLFDPCGSRLLWLEIGSQPMSAEEKKAIRRLFPHARIVQHYGLTEASRTTLLSVHSADERALGGVGEPIAQTEVRTTPEGRIQIRGPHLASGLIIDGKIQSLVDAEGWFTTQDLGSFEDGQLFFFGRADNQINCGGKKTSAERLEAGIEQELRNSNRSRRGSFAVTRVPHSIYGDGILLAYEQSLEPIKEQLINAATQALAADGIRSDGTLSTLALDQLPTTETGKVRRKVIGELFHTKAEVSTQVRQASASPSSPLELLKNRYGAATKKHPESAPTLMELGLDSIQMVELAMHLETALGDLPSDWRELKVDALLERLEAQTKSPAPLVVAGEADPSGPLGASNRNPAGIGFWDLVREDYRTHDKDPVSQGFWALFVNRFGNWRMGIRSRLLRAPFTIVYRISVKSVQVLCGIKLDYTVKVGRRVRLEHFGGMVLGAKEIGDDVVIRQNTTMGIRDMSNLAGKPRIGKGVNIGTGAVIVGDIEIGRYSIIGPNVVVDQDIPAFSSVRLPAPQLLSINTASSEDATPNHAEQEQKI